jgi:hypothetical protein
MRTMIVATACGLTLLLTAGCGGSYEGLVPVSGTVTFDGSPPPAAGFVSFIPKERVAGRPVRPATATFDQSGAYQATSFKVGDGLFPGRYTATVTCNKHDLDYSKKDPFSDASHIADSYKPKEIVVEEGSDALTVDLDVPLKKS